MCGSHTAFMPVAILNKLIHNNKEHYIIFFRPRIRKHSLSYSLSCKCSKYPKLNSVTDFWIDQKQYWQWSNRNNAQQLASLNLKSFLFHMCFQCNPAPNSNEGGQCPVRCWDLLQRRISCDTQDLRRSGSGVWRHYDEGNKTIIRKTTWAAQTQMERARTRTVTWWHYQSFNKWA